MANFADQDFRWNMGEFRRIRKTPEMVAQLEKMGREWVERLNGELHDAQAARKQPVEDGYIADVTTSGTRARLFIVAETARAQVHDARHQSILKQMHIDAVPHNIDVDLPRVYAERANETKQRKAVFLTHVRAFTNA